MTRRHLVGTLILVAGWQLAVSCQPAADITILSPLTDVTTFSFQVQFEITGSSLDLSTLQAKVNGETVAVTGGPVYTATMNPGFPLKDDNVLRVSAKRLGAQSTVQVRPAQGARLRAGHHRRSRDHRVRRVGPDHRSARPQPGGRPHAGEHRRALRRPAGEPARPS
jgi:hypothetical protein